MSVKEQPGDMMGAIATSQANADMHFKSVRFPWGDARASPARCGGLGAKPPDKRETINTNNLIAMKHIVIGTIKHMRTYRDPEAKEEIDRSQVKPEGSVVKIVAKYRSKCAADCGQSIQVGETIWWDSHSKDTNHYMCGKPGGDPDERSYRRSIAHHKNVLHQGASEREKICPECYTVQPVASFVGERCGGCA